MRRTLLPVLIASLGALLMPAAAIAGNEAAPWSAPTYLSAGEPYAQASGPSLSLLSDGSLVATWNQGSIGGPTIPEMASQPFAGDWSAATALSGEEGISAPLDAIGGVRTAASGSGQFVSAWLAPNAEEPSQNDVVGAVGHVTPGSAPSFSPHVFETYSSDSKALDEFPYTPQVAMTMGGTGTVEFTVAQKISSFGPYIGLAPISAGAAGATFAEREFPKEERFVDNVLEGNNDYTKFVPPLAVAGLNATWEAPTNEEEALITNSANYEETYEGVAAPPDSALLYTTASPTAWTSAKPQVLPLASENASAAILPDGKVLVADDTGQINVWETGQSSATVADAATGGAAGRPAIATYFDGSATIAYLDYNGADGTATVKEIDVSPEGALGTPVTVSQPGQRVRDLTAAYGPDGTTYIVWAATDATNEENEDNGIYASVRLPGGSFPATPDTVIEGPNLHPAAPKIAIDATDYATIVAQVFEPNEGVRIAAFTHVNPILPRLISPPEISPSSTPSVGDTLTCSSGKWANQPTTFTYEWLRGGSPIGGATSQTYKLLAADAGAQISCRVTATNAYGSAIGTSAALTVNAVPPIPGETGKAGKAKVKGVHVSKAKVRVTLACPATVSACSPAKLILTVVEHLRGKRITAVTASHVKGHAKRRKGKSRKRSRSRTVTIGHAIVKLSAGQSKTVTVPLNRKGRSLLERYKHLPATLSLRSGESANAIKKVKLKTGGRGRKPKKRHKRR